MVRQKYELEELEDHTDKQERLKALINEIHHDVMYYIVLTLITL